MPFYKRIFFAFISLTLLTFLPINVHSNQLACECDRGVQYEEMPAIIIVPPSQVRSPQFQPMPPTPQVQPIPVPQKSEKVIRAAIDIGSGATKLRIAEVNTRTQKIEKVLENTSFPVQYQENLMKSPNNTFDEQVMQTGIEAIRKSAEIASKYNAQKIIAVATASFRKADNAQEFIDKIYEETGVRVYVIDQELEGKLAFNAVLSQGRYDPTKLIVWDIGGGSLQLTALDRKGDYSIYRGDVASIQFKNQVIQDIKHQDVAQITTPNPMTKEQIQQSIVKAREIGQKVDQVFKDRINQKGQVVGVGNIFAYGIYPIVDKKNIFSQQDLFKATMNLANKNDAEVGGGDYANVQVTNAILVLGYMQDLNLNQMDILDINNADGALIYPEFWN